ncbi:MAG: YdcF family protein [Alphaproteobacteria bacterium]|nr:YdcF family protein [Alphaproteobacteria bacterium]
MLVDGVMILGKELRRYPERARRELRARAAAASVALRHGAREVLSLEDVLRGQQHSGSRIVAELLHELGVPPERVVLAERTRSTREEALEGARLSLARGYRRLVAVTSAYHVPRARYYFTEAFRELVPPEACQVEVVAPESFLQRANEAERRWIEAGTPGPDCFRQEQPMEMAFGAFAALLRPLPRRLRWSVEVEAAAAFRRVS